MLEEYKLLDNLIDALYSDGVDTSYFPDNARETLRDYSKKIKIK